jgi:hypothetical protein
MNAPRICKLRKNCLTVIDQCAIVLKTRQFLHFSIKTFQVRNEFSRSYLNWLPNCQFYNKEALSYFKGLSEVRDWRIFLKIFIASVFNDDL